MMKSTPAVLVLSLSARMAAAVALALALSGSIARGDDIGVSISASTSAPGSPVEEFAQQLERFQKTVPDLNKSILDSVGTITNATDVEKARAEIDSLRETVSTLLGAVSDNGPVSQLGIKALNHIHDKLKRLSQETRFKPEERQFLIDQWRRIQGSDRACDQGAGRRAHTIRRPVADLADE